MTRKEAIDELAQAMINEQILTAAEIAEEYEKEGHDAIRDGDKDTAIEKLGLALMYRNIECHNRGSLPMLKQLVFQHLDGICPDSGPDSIGWALRGAVQKILK